MLKLEGGLKNLMLMPCTNLTSIIRRSLVWIHLGKERFPSKCKSKIIQRSDDPFKMLEKIGPNAYQVDLPGEYGVFSTFNVANLSPYHEENEELQSLRSNSH